LGMSEKLANVLRANLRIGGAVLEKMPMAEAVVQVHAAPVGDVIGKWDVFVAVGHYQPAAAAAYPRRRGLAPLRPS